ncbi:hypothetical protein BDZ88DRAFT_479377 [Geranomyces variabilis]|nr:hypothetical protein BDZ88DRAFT_479377 [Geranomyces variabilis]KAJ3140772.1 hypothetical protein HDU90_008077 [Geranomyces variabilis]
MKVSSILAGMAVLFAATISASPVASAGDRRLISLSPTESKWMTDDEVLGLIRTGKHFIDVTDRDVDFSAKPASFAKQALPKPSQQALITPILSQIDQDKMKTWLTALTQFNNRYYKSSTGKQASQWIQQQVEAVAATAKPSVTVTVTPFVHSWGQNSVIARIVPANTTISKTTPIVVVGAHLDSINQRNPMNGRAPGADDDGSGSVTIFEVYRLILANGIVPSRPVEFHWYSGEEGGLLGSQKVVAKYKADKIPVLGMMQVDMTGYHPDDKEEVIGISTDYVDPTLSKFLQQCATEYVTRIKWAPTACGYGCSDHASWTGAGFPAAFAFESLFDDSNPVIHSEKDDMSTVDFAHAAEFVRLILGFSIELGVLKA